jgi:hypothetical protein
VSEPRLSSADRKAMKKAFKEAAKQEKADAKAAKAAEKAAAKQAKAKSAEGAGLSKADAKAAKAQAKADAKAAKLEAKAAAKVAKKDGTAAQKTKSPRKQAKAQKQAERELLLAERMARYKQLRANVRRRRVMYGLFIVLAIAVFAGSIWDILYNSSDLMVAVFVAYGVIFLWGLLLLFSRQRHLEEVEEMLALERVFMEDPATGEIFQLAASKLPALEGLEFSSPVSGQFFRMPSLSAKHVERVLPGGALQSKTFKHNGVEGEVATFGKEPKPVQFR